MREALRRLAGEGWLTAFADLMRHPSEPRLAEALTDAVLQNETGLHDFKTVNDLFGHMAGDRPLQAAARHIASSVRGTDLVARYGGDEFLVVLADTDGAEAQGVAERVRGALAGGRLALGTGAELVPTLSAGGIEAQVGQSVDDLMPAADHPPRATAPATPASTCRRRRSSRRRRFGQRPTRGRRSRTRR